MRVGQPPFLHAELGPLAECPAVRLLADEADPLRLQVARDSLQAFSGACEVGTAQVARTGCRSKRRIREPDAFVQHLVLLVRFVHPRRELRCVQQPPEVVARIREVRTGGRRDAARIDPAEHDTKILSENVRNGGVAN